MFPKISVIVPVYKVEEYLEECIESLVNQTMKEIEIILVDDGSPDHCGAICDQYAQKYSNITVIHQKNGGLSCARNQGLSIAKGEYISFVDSDDYVKENMLETLYNACMKNHTKMAACNFFYVIDDIVQYQMETNDLLKFSSADFLKKIISTENRIGVVVWNKLFHRSLLGEKTFPEGKLYEDLGSTYKMIFAAGEISFVDSGLYFYRKLRKGAITTYLYSEREIDRIKFVDEMAEFIKINLPEIYIEAVNYKLETVYLPVMNNMIVSNVYDAQMYRMIKSEILRNWKYITRGKLRYIKKYNYWYVQLVSKYIVCCIRLQNKSDVRINTGSFR